MWLQSFCPLTLWKSTLQNYEPWFATAFKRLPKIGKAQICLPLLTMEMLISAYSVILNWSMRLAGNAGLRVCVWATWRQNGGVGAGSESGGHGWGRGHYPHQENIEWAQTNGNNGSWWSNNGEGSPRPRLVLNPGQAGCITPLGIRPAPDSYQVNLGCSLLSLPARVEAFTQTFLNGRASCVHICCCPTSHLH